MIKIKAYVHKTENGQETEKINESKSYKKYNKINKFPVRLINKIEKTNIQYQH